MKIIDEKGRLFGKINVIDFLALFFILCLMPMFYFGYKLYLGNKKAVAELQGKAAKQLAIEAQKKEKESMSLSDKATERVTRPASSNQIDEIINRIAILEKAINNKEAAERVTRPASSNQIDEIINRITILEEKVNFILSSPKIK